MSRVFALWSIAEQTASDALSHSHICLLAYAYWLVCIFTYAYFAYVISLLVFDICSTRGWRIFVTLFCEILKFLSSCLWFLRLSCLVSIVLFWAIFFSSGVEYYVSPWEFRILAQQIHIFPKLRILNKNALGIKSPIPNLQQPILIKSLMIIGTRIGRRT